LYLYSIKIQSNIDQNEVKNLRKITNFFEFFFRAGPSSAHVAGLDPAGLDPASLAGSLAQTSDPAGQEITHACALFIVQVNYNSLEQ
jgi:hypothetical protein